MKHCEVYLATGIKNYIQGNRDLKASSNRCHSSQRPTCNDGVKEGTRGNENE